MELSCDREQALGGGERGDDHGFHMIFLQTGTNQITFLFSEPVSQTCSSSDFTCSNGNCIDARLRCDDENDCGDNSDEKNCDPRKQSNSFPFVAGVGC